MELVALLPCLLLLGGRDRPGLPVRRLRRRGGACCRRGRPAAARGAPAGAAVRAVLPGPLARSARVRVGPPMATVAVTLSVPRVLPLPALHVGAVER